MSQSSHFERLTNYSLETPWRYVEGLLVSDLDPQILHHLYEDSPTQANRLMEAVRVCRVRGQEVWAALVSWWGMPVIPLGLQLHGQQVTNSSPDGYLVDVHGRQICQYLRLPSDGNQRQVLVYGLIPETDPDRP